MNQLEQGVPASVRNAVAELKVVYGKLNDEINSKVTVEHDNEKVLREIANPRQN